MPYFSKYDERIGLFVESKDERDLINVKAGGRCTKQWPVNIEDHLLTFTKQRLCNLGKWVASVWVNATPITGLMDPPEFQFIVPFETDAGWRQARVTWKINDTHGQLDIPLLNEFGGLERRELWEYSATAELIELETPDE